MLAERRPDLADDEKIVRVREGRVCLPITPIRDGLSAIPLTPVYSAEERGRQPITNTPVQPPAKPDNSGTSGTSNTGSGESGKK